MKPIPQYMDCVEAAKSSASGSHVLPPPPRNPPPKSKMGSLELIIGCMFSGKSSLLIRRIHELADAGLNILAINHASDKRYSQKSLIHTHNHVSYPCYSATSISDAVNAANLALYDHVCIDEAHFFADLSEQVVKITDHYNKCVIVAGLSGTYARAPFPQIMNLIPHADIIHHLKGTCSVCGNPAIFSKRLTSESETMVVGGSEKYTCVCRNCI